MNIENKYVLITGAAIRVGSALARRFAEHGAKIILHYNCSAKEASETFDTIGGKAKGHKLIHCDLSDKSCAEKIFTDAGHVDILVNNASIYNPKALLNESAEELEKQFRINFFAPLELMKKFASQPDIKDSCIINFLDQRIGNAYINDGSYALSKSSLAEATLAAALQWAPSIRVNGIAPGPVLPPKGIENSKMEKVLKQVPLGKAVRLDDITETCLFIVKNDSMTGSIIYVDGGQHLNT